MTEFKVKDFEKTFWIITSVEQYQNIRKNLFHEGEIKLVGLNLYHRYIKQYNRDNGFCIFHKKVLN